MGKWMTRILIAMLCLLTLSIPAFAESEDEGYGWTAFSNTSQNTLTWMNGIPIDLDPSQYEAIDFQNYRPIDTETPELGDSSFPMWLLIGCVLVGASGTIAVHKLRRRVEVR